MKLILIVTFVVSVSYCLGSPSGTALLVRQRRDVDFYANTKSLIQELITSLRGSIQQAIDAVSKFSTGLQDMGTQFGEQLVKNVEKYRSRVRASIKSVTDRFTGAGAGVRECIDNHRQEAEDLFSGIVTKSKACADERIKEIRDMIDQLKELSANATEYTISALAEMQGCTQNSAGILTTGTCLGGVAVRTELKGAVFVVQSGLLIARINLSLSTLPAALEVCAGTRIVEAGIGSAKIVFEIGGCSASSAYSSIMGNKVTSP
ncbi:hypothetical protein KGM_208986 [Danaus plexippus plexippus]|uniref:Uncharacterized protein n=1 Tax=Danaus plexippus plexippus TaxID=278856 RepID=A0A212FE28_DANPL|nr:hypothetical protein KGM_208986 [Danaus plexippus plexippus]